MARMRKKGNEYMVLVGKREGRRPLGKPGFGWKGDIQLYLQEVGWGSRGLVGHTWRAVVKAVINLRSP